MRPRFHRAPSSVPGRDPSEVIRKLRRVLQGFLQCFPEQLCVMQHHAELLGGGGTHFVWFLVGGTVDEKRTQQERERELRRGRVIL